MAAKSNRHHTGTEKHSIQYHAKGAPHRDNAIPGINPSAAEVKGSAATMRSEKMVGSGKESSTPSNPSPKISGGKNRY